MPSSKQCSAKDCANVASCRHELLERASEDDGIDRPICQECWDKLEKMQKELLNAISKAGKAGAFHKM